MKITAQIVDAIIQCTNNRFLINFDWCPQIKSTCFLNKFIEAIQENQQEGTDFSRANKSNNEVFGPIR